MFAFFFIHKMCYIVKIAFTKEVISFIIIVIVNVRIIFFRNKMVFARVTSASVFFDNICGTKICTGGTFVVNSYMAFRANTFYITTMKTIFTEHLYILLILFVAFQKDYPRMFWRFLNQFSTQSYLG